MVIFGNTKIMIKSRFIQQTQLPKMTSRFIPKAICPSCGSSLSSDLRQKKEKTIVKTVKKKEKKTKTD